MTERERNALNKRRAMKGQLTRIKNYILTVQSLEKEDITKEIILNLEVRVASINNVNEKFNNIQDEIDLLTDETNIEEQDEERANFNDEVFKLLADVQIIIEGFHDTNQRNQSGGASSVRSGSSHVNSHQSDERQMSDIKLPRIQIPPFDGTYEKWVEFKDMFSALVHNNRNLADCQKFYYLKSLLSGEAIANIQSIQVSSANYHVAWQLLNKRFDNKALIVNSYIKGLFELQPIMRESASQLRNLLDIVNKNLNCLQALNQPTDQWDTIIVNLVVSKFDSITRRDWEKERSSHDQLPTFDDIKTFLEHRCIALENVQPKNNQNHISRSNKPQANANQFKYRSTNALSVNSCKICKQGEHAIYFCNTFKSMPVQQRIFEVKKLRLCANCLRQNHSINNCNASKCRMCQGMHNTLLHQSNYHKHQQESNQLMNSNMNSGNHIQNFSEALDSQGLKSANHAHASNQNHVHHQHQSEISTNNVTQSNQSHANMTNNQISNQKQPSNQNQVLNSNQNQIQFGQAYMQDNNQQVYTLVKDSSTNLSQSNQCNQINEDNSSTETLLATAMVNVRSKSGNMHTCRALLDPGSQSNFVSANVAKSLGLRLTKHKTILSGINSSGSNSNHKTNVLIKSRVNNYQTKISCLVVPKITVNLPINSFNAVPLNIPNNLQMADSSFNISSKIDLLIGGDIFWELLCIGQITLGKNLPLLQKTQLGWVLAGKFESITSNNLSISCVNAIELDRLVASFWDVENIATDRILTVEERKCEDHFLSNTIQNAQGRFVVKIPFKENHAKLGNSYNQALNRFLSLERKLESNSELKQSYISFMREYEQLGHMKPVDRTNQSSTVREFFLPHHPIIREHSLTTKIRIVFDASCLSDNNNSLNSIQMTGPVVQSDLFSILIRFRKYRYVLTSDIEKMYRQILVDENDQPSQRIFWREDKNQPLQIYQLETVTYGTTSAPFLATRCLKALADQFKDSFPVESQIIEDDFYVDDMLTGSNSLRDLKIIKKNIISILSSAGFILRKFLSNSDQLLEHDNETNVQSLNLDMENTSKTLGLIWNAKEDKLQCSIGKNNISSHNKVSKRIILSLTAQIFDPLGLFAPTVIIAKMILQQLWQSNVSWDESVPLNIHTKWLELQNQFNALSYIKIPRFAFASNFSRYEIHGFCDASERAYGACIYIRSINEQGLITTNLLTAKSRVAPIKSITLPRLELCAAVLLSELLHKTTKALQIPLEQIFCWTDSQITLAWINSTPNRWKIFVANRVTKIQEKIPKALWYHVESKSNPADVISRGVMPNKLQNLSLWWQGPAFLQNERATWPVSKCNVDAESMPETKTQVHICFNNTPNINLFNKFSTFNKLKRVTAYCIRFIKNCKLVSEQRSIESLQKSELQEATTLLIKLAQLDSFAEEIETLRNNKQLQIKSSLSQLNVFLDNEGVIRIGGRLRHSALEYDKKHPILLSSKHNLTKLIATYEHIRLLHCGPQELLYSLRAKFWPTSGRNLTRHIVRNCVRCFRSNPVHGNQQMGDLPAFRVTPSHPFVITCTDYAGPFNIRDRKGRGYKITKSYICLYVCASIKAVHLEIVTDLTSECFVAALRRFVSRRGTPTDLYSDNATTYVGANSKLKELYQFLAREKDHLHEAIAQLSVKWHFIPARTPHHGGLWEAAVKSVKHHLNRVVGETVLTYEELSTITIQIEAVLNSRPLSPLSSHPNDPYPLSPAHFLIGRAITNLPDLDYSHVPENRLDSYQRNQHMIGCFWKRWHKEYLNELQLRTKWKNQTTHSPTVGDVVIIKDENTAPLKWPLGRIEELHPGADGITRVVSIRRANGHIIKRGIVKVCILPKAATNQM